jgi:hypothetical protein
MRDAAVGRIEYVHRAWPARASQLSSIRAAIRCWLAPLGLTADTAQEIVLA